MDGSPHQPKLERKDESKAPVEESHVEDVSVKAPAAGSGPAAGAGPEVGHRLTVGGAVSGTIVAPYGLVDVVVQLGYSNVINFDRMPGVGDSVKRGMTQEGTPRDSEISRAAMESLRRRLDTVTKGDRKNFYVTRVPDPYASAVFLLEVGPYVEAAKKAGLKVDRKVAFANYRLYKSFAESNGLIVTDAVFNVSSDRPKVAEATLPASAPAVTPGASAAAAKATGALGVRAREEGDEAAAAEALAQMRAVGATREPEYQVPKQQALHSSYARHKAVAKAPAPIIVGTTYSESKEHAFKAARVEESGLQGEIARLKTQLAEARAETAEALKAAAAASKEAAALKGELRQTAKARDGTREHAAQLESLVRSETKQDLQYSVPPALTLRKVAAPPVGMREIPARQITGQQAWFRNAVQASAKVTPPAHYAVGKLQAHGFVATEAKEMGTDTSKPVPCLVARVETSERFDPLPCVLGLHSLAFFPTTRDALFLEAFAVGAMVLHCPVAPSRSTVGQPYVLVARSGTPIKPLNSSYGIGFVGQAITRHTHVRVSTNSGGPPISVYLVHPSLRVSSVFKAAGLAPLALAMQAGRVKVVLHRGPAEKRIVHTFRQDVKFDFREDDLLVVAPTGLLGGAKGDAAVEDGPVEKKKGKKDHAKKKCELFEDCADPVNCPFWHPPSHIKLVALKKQLEDRLSERGGDKGSDKGAGRDKESSSVAASEATQEMKEEAQRLRDEMQDIRAVSQEVRDYLHAMHGPLRRARVHALEEKMMGPFFGADSFTTTLKPASARLKNYVVMAYNEFISNLPKGHGVTVKSQVNLVPFGVVSQERSINHTFSFLPRTVRVGDFVVTPTGKNDEFGALATVDDIHGVRKVTMLGCRTTYATITPSENGDGVLTGEYATADWDAEPPEKPQQSTVEDLADIVIAPRLDAYLIADPGEQGKIEASMWATSYAILQAEMRGYPDAETRKRANLVYKHVKHKLREAKSPLTYIRTDFRRSPAKYVGGAAAVCCLLILGLVALGMGYGLIRSAGSSLERVAANLAVGGERAVAGGAGLIADARQAIKDDLRELSGGSAAAIKALEERVVNLTLALEGRASVAAASAAGAVKTVAKSAGEAAVSAGAAVAQTALSASKHARRAARRAAAAAKSGYSAVKGAVESIAEEAVGGPEGVKALNDYVRQRKESTRRATRNRVRDSLRKEWLKAEMTIPVDDNKLWEELAFTHVSTAAQVALKVFPVGWAILAAEEYKSHTTLGVAVVRTLLHLGSDVAFFLPPAWGYPLRAVITACHFAYNHHAEASSLATPWRVKHAWALGARPQPERYGGIVPDGSKAQGPNKFRLSGTWDMPSQPRLGTLEFAPITGLPLTVFAPDVCNMVSAFVHRCNVVEFPEVWKCEGAVQRMYLKDVTDALRLLPNQAVCFEAALARCSTNTAKTDILRGIGAAEKALTRWEVFVKHEVARLVETYKARLIFSCPPSQAIVLSAHAEGLARQVLTALDQCNLGLYWAKCDLDFFHAMDSAREYLRTGRRRPVNSIHEDGFPLMGAGERAHRVYQPRVDLPQSHHFGLAVDLPWTGVPGRWFVIAGGDDSFAGCVRDDGSVVFYEYDGSSFDSHHVTEVWADFYREFCPGVAAHALEDAITFQGRKNGGSISGLIRRGMPPGNPLTSVYNTLFVFGIFMAAAALGSDTSEVLSRIEEAGRRAGHKLEGKKSNSPLNHTYFSARIVRARVEGREGYTLAPLAVRTLSKMWTADRSQFEMPLEEKYSEDFAKAAALHTRLLRVDPDAAEFVRRSALTIPGSSMLQGASAMQHWESKLPEGTIPYLQERSCPYRDITLTYLAENSLTDEVLDMEYGGQARAKARKNLGLLRRCELSVDSLPTYETRPRWRGWRAAFLAVLLLLLATSVVAEQDAFRGSPGPEGRALCAGPTRSGSVHYNLNHFVKMSQVSKNMGKAARKAQKAASKLNVAVNKMDKERSIMRQEEKTLVTRKGSAAPAKRKPTGGMREVKDGRRDAEALAATLLDPFGVKGVRIPDESARASAVLHLYQRVALTKITGGTPDTNQYWGIQWIPEMEIGFNVISAVAAKTTNPWDAVITWASGGPAGGSTVHTTLGTQCYLFRCVSGGVRMIDVGPLYQRGTTVFSNNTMTGGSSAVTSIDVLNADEGTSITDSAKIEGGLQWTWRPIDLDGQPVFVTNNSSTVAPSGTSWRRPDGPTASVQGADNCITLIFYAPTGITVSDSPMVDLCWNIEVIPFSVYQIYYDLKMVEPNTASLDQARRVMSNTKGQSSVGAKIVRGLSSHHEVRQKLIDAPGIVNGAEGLGDIPIFRMPRGFRWVRVGKKAKVTFEELKDKLRRLVGKPSVPAIPIGPGVRPAPNPTPPKPTPTPPAPAPLPPRPGPAPTPQGPTITPKPGMAPPHVIGKYGKTAGNTEMPMTHTMIKLLWNELPEGTRSLFKKVEPYAESIDSFVTYVSEKTGLPHELVEVGLAAILIEVGFLLAELPAVEVVASYASEFGSLIQSGLADADIASLLNNFRYEADLGEVFDLFAERDPFPLFEGQDPPLGWLGDALQDQPWRDMPIAGAFPSLVNAAGVTLVPNAPFQPHVLNNLLAAAVMTKAAADPAWAKSVGIQIDPSGVVTGYTYTAPPPPTAVLDRATSAFVDGARSVGQTVVDFGKSVVGTIGGWFQPNHKWAHEFAHLVDAARYSPFECEEARRHCASRKEYVMWLQLCLFGEKAYPALVRRPSEVETCRVDCIDPAVILASGESSAGTSRSDGWVV